MKITGKITKVLPVRTGTSKKGSTWAAQQFVLETEGDGAMLLEVRSEERRVGKECRSRWSPYH